MELMEWKEELDWKEVLRVMLEVLRAMLELWLREVERGGVKGSRAGRLRRGERRWGVTGALWHVLFSSGEEGSDRILVLLVLGESSGIICCVRSIYSYMLLSLAWKHLGTRTLDLTNITRKMYWRQTAPQRFESCRGLFCKFLSVHQPFSLTTGRAKDLILSNSDCVGDRAVRCSLNFRLVAYVMTSHTADIPHTTDNEILRD